MPEIFISYSRIDRDFVEELRTRFSAVGRDTWVDVTDIPPTAKWRSEVLASIEQANAFVFVLSPDSVVSRECRREVAHAVRHNKRIVPVVWREVDPQAVLPDLAELNWIQARSVDAGFDTLLRAIDTDLDWLRAHTRLGVRALEWDAKDREPSLLLRGLDFRAAEDWLADAAGHEPVPTSLQAEYVRASRRATIARRRVVTSLLASAVFVVAALGFVVYERGGPINSSIAQIKQRMAEARPSQQPISTATATIEIVIASLDAGQWDTLDFDVNVHDLGCLGLVTLMKGTEGLLTLSSSDCYVRKERNGETVFRAMVNMDPSDAASGRPASWLTQAESMRVGISAIHSNSRVARGQVLFTVNGSIRMEIGIPPQVFDEDTALASIPEACRGPQQANRNSAAAVEEFWLIRCRHEPALAGAPRGSDRSSSTLFGNLSTASFGIAIERGSLKAIKTLVESGADPDTPINNGAHTITPLMKACQMEKLEIAEYLIDHGADVNGVDEEGNTALQGAVQHVELVRMLISRRAHVNTRNVRDDTPLGAAAWAGSAEVVRVLAEAGADLKAETHGLTPLMLAASAGQIETIRLLVRLGAPVNQRSTLGGETALFSAIYSGKTGAVQALLDLKADVNVKTTSGDTPVKAAQKGDQTNMLALLQTAGATEAANLALESSRNPGVNAAAPRNRRLDPEKTALLWSAIDDGFAIDARTLPKVLARAKTLVAEGADVNALGLYNQSMVLRAVDTGNLELLDVLIRAGADVNMANEYKIAPLASAAERGKQNMVLALIRAGANVNARNISGGTAVQVAVLRGFTEIVRILIEAGADIGRDREELLGLARQRKHPAVEKLLLEATK